MSGLIGDSTPRNKQKSVEWYTPGWIFELLALDFNLDPASPHDMQSVVPARLKFTLFDDGLKQPWTGKVWLNPPYNRETPLWMRKMIEHGNGIALVFSRTDAKWFQEALHTADATLLMSGRIQFIPGIENQHKRARSGAGSALFAWGEDCKQALFNMRDYGYLICR